MTIFFYTYVLLDIKFNFYVGYTENLKNRVREHKTGKVFATKNKLPIELIYCEASLNKYDALAREKYLKSGPGKRYLRNRLKRFLIDRPRAS